MDTKRTLIVPVTFVTVGAPVVLNTADHSVRRKFRVDVTVVDALELAAWLLASIRTLMFGPATAAATARVAGGTWGDGSLWGFSEDQ